MHISPQSQTVSAVRFSFSAVMVGAFVMFVFTGLDTLFVNPGRYPLIAVALSGLVGIIGFVGQALLGRLARRLRAGEG